MKVQSTGGIHLARFLQVVQDLEKQRGSRIWCVVHAGRGHICGPTLYSLFAARDEIGAGDKVEILIHSPGGHPDIAYRTMKFFRRRFSEVNVIVPLMAKSAATLMCLGADKIFMGEFAELGPIDIQIDDQVQHGGKNFSPLNEFKSIEFMREQAIEWMDYYATLMNVQYGFSIQKGLEDSVDLVTGLMRPMFEKIEPLGMGEHRRALAVSEEYAKRMISLTGNKNAKGILRRVVWDYPSHDFCIDYDESLALGLPIERLSESQDRLLTRALLELNRDDSYHGFATSEKKQEPGQPLRKKRSTKAVRTGHVNGRSEDSQEQRLRPSRTAI